MTQTPARIEPGPHAAAEVAREAARLEGASPEEILGWAASRYGGGLTLACSFGGPTGMALLHMASTVAPGIDVFYVDTAFLFPETYDLARAASDRYGTRPRVFASRWTPEQQAAAFGPELWRRDPDLCCQLRKVEPNGRALEGKAAWVSGLRRDQASTRAGVAPVEWDAKFGLVKVNPMAAWTEDDVWAYVRASGALYNALHDRGYPSIGCTHCTRPVRPGEDSRAGRWADQGKEECGLHADTMAGREVSAATITG